MTTKAKGERSKQYIPARPETLASMVRDGKLPRALPVYIERASVERFDTIRQAVDSSSSNIHQRFVIEVNIPVTLKGHEISSFDVHWVQKIICASHRSMKLILQLLKDDQKPPIEVHENEFSHVLIGAKRLLDSPLKQSPMKGMLPDKGSPPFSLLSSPLRPALKAAGSIERLSSALEHQELLRKAFTSAKRSILITSFDIDHATLRRICFYEWLDLAVQRGVRIYIYFNDVKRADVRALNIFSRYGEQVKCSEALTHSKFLCVDNHEWIAVGSFNWLAAHSSYDAQIKCEGSIVSYYRELNKSLSEEIWCHIRYYRNLQFGNFGAVDAHCADSINECTVGYDLPDDSSLQYIPTLGEHCGFLRQAIEKAQRKVVICSPFLSSIQYRQDLDIKWLKKQLQRGIELVFITSSRSPGFDEFKRYLSSLPRTAVYLIGYPKFHLKTVIADDSVIAEGSFNWLSATRFEGSDYHSHEATLVVTGQAASPLIVDFYQSDVGQLVLNVEIEKIEAAIMTQSAGK